MEDCWNVLIFQCKHPHLLSCVGVGVHHRFGRFLRMVSSPPWLSLSWSWKATPSAWASLHGTPQHATSSWVQVNSPACTCALASSTILPGWVDPRLRRPLVTVDRLRQPNHHLERGHGPGHDFPGGHAPWCHLQCGLESQREPDLHLLQRQGYPCHRPPEGGDCCCKWGRPSFCT